jgi:RNA polymerase sigma-70 factor, ECF subfamily
MNATEQFESYRPLLFAIAYRMVGSAMEAEDLVQESYLRYQAAGPETIHSPKAFLSTVTTRLCLNHLQSARVQREQYVGPWLPEPIGTGADRLASPADEVARYESISLAFLTLLEALTPLERAVFLLREVFDYEYGEIAIIVDKSEVACRQLFSRAKKQIAQRRPRFRPTPDEHRQLLDRFIQAVNLGELESLTQLLADDVTLWADGGGKVRGAATQPVQGRATVARFIMASTRFLPAGYGVKVAEVNGAPAAVIVVDERPHFLIALEVARGMVQEVRVVANPDKLQRV